MPEPGTVMLKWVGIFLLLGVVMRLVRRALAALISFGFAGALFLLLVILLVQGVAPSGKRAGKTARNVEKLSAQNGKIPSVRS